MEYLIRDCREDDLPTLVTLCQKHADYEKASYNTEGKQNLLRKMLLSESAKLFCLIVESDKKPVGYASYTFNLSTWSASEFLYLDCLYLEPDFRGMGIGEVMINKIKAIALDRGCAEIQWQTPAFNEGAIKFYKRVGALGKDKVRFFLNAQSM
jgi:GNAT superfamily N-acetyltransferase